MHKTERTISQKHIHPGIALKRKKIIFDLCDTLSVQVRVLKLCMLITSFKFDLFIQILVILAFSSPLGSPKLHLQHNILWVVVFFFFKCTGL